MTDQLEQLGLLLDEQDEDLTSAAGDEARHEKLRATLQALNSQLLELNARAGEVDSEIQSVKLKLRDVAKQLQQQQTDRTWHEIGLPADKKRRTRNRMGRPQGSATPRNSRKQ